MGKNKLEKFAENLKFENLFQAEFGLNMPDFLMKGQWAENFFKNENPLVLELGCGKGEYTVGLAKKYPNINFMGLDIKGARLWSGLKNAEKEKLNNVAFLRTRIDFIEQFFAAEEVSEIWITFPDPQAKKERKRLTSPVFLERYRKILKKDGIIHLKTDDSDLYDYTLHDVIEAYAHPLIYASDDLYNEASPEMEVKEIRTFYESMWLEQGKKIKYLSFRLANPA